MSLQDDPAAAAYYEGEARKLAALCRTILNVEIDLDYLQDAVRHAHTVGPIADPTAYRDGMPNLRDMERVVRAAKAFRHEIQAVVDEDSGFAEKPFTEESG